MTVTFHGFAVAVGRSEYALRKEFPTLDWGRAHQHENHGEKTWALFFKFGSKNRARAGSRRRSLRPVVTRRRTLMIAAPG